MDKVKRYTLDSSVSELVGVGKTTAERLSKIGIQQVRDLVYHFPRAYENRGAITLLSDCVENTPSPFLLTVACEVKNARTKSGITVSKFRAFDESGVCEIVFFNSPYVKDVFHTGALFRFYGKAQMGRGGHITLQNPKYEAVIPDKELDDLIPIYPLTEGISSKVLSKLIRSVINEVAAGILDPLPEKIRFKNSLPTLAYALRNIHFPESREALFRSQRRLAFDEMLYFALGVSLAASTKSKNEGVSFSPVSISPLLELLPYELTGAQKNAVNDVYRDTVLKKENGKTPAMARIIVGDVGSGKTVCAIISMYIAIRSGYQTALMAPTEILATQHYEEIKPLFDKLGIKAVLLTGSTKASQKKKIYDSAEKGEIDAVIGTHALLSEKLCFSNLGLIITDEQHRFGVNQRAILKDRTKAAHMLVMSATPIPRTLALALYGDLDVSRINEMPKGRMRVDTFVVDESYRARLNGFIEKQVALGGQCYIVCPSIDKASDEEALGLTSTSLASINMVDNGKLNLKNTVQYTEELKNALPHLKIECMHGRMKAKEKDEIMQAFARGEIQVLISTTVIEVGVNVPNATLMVVENAERFGLSQLHQLRGRVGRGNKKSYCVLVSGSVNEKSRERLEVMKTTYDGYAIADKDLMLRGPGDFFSSNTDNNLRQSGGFKFKLASSCDDTTLFEAAFSSAKDIIKDDPTLSLSEHFLIKQSLAHLTDNSSTIS